MQQETVLIQQSTAELVVEELFRGQDQTFCQSQASKYQAFENELVEHVHLLLEKEAKTYRNNRVFKQTLERLMDPVQEVCFSFLLTNTFKAINVL